MFDEKIKEIEASIEALNMTISAKTAELKEFLNQDDLEKARAIRAEIDQAKTDVQEAENNLDLYTAAKNNASHTPTKVGAPVATEGEEMDYRDKVNAFIRSKGTVVNEGLRFGGKEEVLIPMNDVTPINPKQDGVKKTDTTKVTSEEILYTPAREIKTTVDLKQFTTIYPAKKAAGKYPILKKATAKLISVEELEKNPALAKPEFTEVDWKVTTYRGAIPISQESIDDADVDLVGIVAESAGQMKVNTTNTAISTVLKSFTAKDVKSLDDLKHIINVDLDPAYNVAFVVSQSFYQILDTLKDGNGRYLLQDSITSVSGKVFNGKPVFVLNDEELGAAGEAKAFVGDFKRGVLFADRKDLGLRWVDNDVHGQYLQAVLRFGVKKVDDKAGFFVTFKPSTAR